MRRFLPLVTALVLAPSAIHAAIIDVFPTSSGALQSAINAAAPGDILRIHGGTYDSIFVNKPLELIAEPQATILGRSIDPTGPGFIMIVPPIRMIGPGQGRVTLQNIVTGGLYNANVFPYSGPAKPNVEVRGFDELRIFECDILGPYWSGSGGLEGDAGILTDVPRVILSGTTLRALDPYTTSISPPAAPKPALMAPDSTVIAVNCDIEGGKYIGIQACTGGSYDARLIGAPGIVCQRLVQTGGSIRGGEGPTLSCLSGPDTKVPDGVGAIALEHIVQPETLRELDPPRIGQTWRLLSVLGGSGGFLRVAFDIGPIEFNPTFGYNVVETAQVFAFANLSGYGGVTQFPVPNVASLIGFDLAAEVLDFGYGRFGGSVLTQVR